jgi:hypothetical protein
VVAGQRAAAREVPDDLGVEQLAQGVNVPLGERVVASADKLLVWVCQRRLLSLPSARKLRRRRSIDET